MREIYDFNKNWRFVKLYADSEICHTDVQEKNYDDSLWEHVTLPHTYNDVDGVSGRTGICEGGEHYYRGLVCYRKRFYCDYVNKSTYIEFGAANTVAKIYVNGLFVGKHEGGYSAFRFNITDYIYPGENVIAVMVNNAPTDYIAPITDQGDFTKMGGLYRDVKLLVMENAHIDQLDYGSSGIYITPENITKEKADIDILIKLINETETDKDLSVIADIYDMQDQLVAEVRGKDLVPRNEKKDVTLITRIDTPQLWHGRKNPYLYTVEISVFEAGHLLDKEEQTFGVRTYEITREQGFYLNGEYLDLRGVNYHQDSYENGWAMTEWQRERDYRMMYDMGCNSVRMAHYQHCQNEYEICDKFGFIVWTEVGIVNKMSANDKEQVPANGFAQNAKQQLIELIRQNYNHPSVIVWGISNELYQMNDEIYGVYEELCMLARKEDATRLLAAADSQFWGRFLNLPVDVIGYNRYFGWYQDAGPAEKFGEWLDLYHRKKANHPQCVSEYGGGGAISQHKDHVIWETEIDPWGRRHYENYQSLMHEKIWEQFATRNYLWAKYVWCMFDFASDGREEGDTKGQNDKGLATRERIPKDAYYFYQSIWSSNPMLHITEKRFTQRENSRIPVKVYSNAENVRLYVNHKFIGRLNRNPKLQTVFSQEDIMLEKGENDILVTAEFPDGNSLQDHVKWYCKS